MPSWGFEMPEEFKGKTKEDLVNELKEGREAKTKIAELEGKFNTLAEVNTNLNGSLSALTDRLATLEVGIQERGQQGQQRQQQQQQQNRMVSIVDDEEEYFNQRFNAKSKPLISAMLMQQARTAHREGMTIIERNPTLAAAYSKLTAECENLFKTLNDQQQLEASSYPSCVQLAIGQNLSKLKDMINKDNGTLELLSSTAGQNHEQKQKVQLSDDQKRAAKGFGLTEEEYAEFATA